MFFQNVTDQAFDEIHNMESLFHICVIFVGIIVERNSISVIMVNSRCGDYRPSKIAPKVFDMRYENGMVVTDFTKRARTDQSLKGIKKLYKENPELANKEEDEIIKNTYRTLMTRGMKGCYVYCTDKRLAAYLKKCLETRKSEGKK